MNKHLVTAITSLLIGTASMSSIATAQDNQTWQPTQQQITPQTIEDPVMIQINYLQTEWARIKYQLVDEDRQLNEIHMLEDHAEKVTAHYPDRAEPKIWEGIILSTDAGIVKGMSALGKVKKAKELFEQSLALDPYAMNGSAHTSLGSLYYQVPGWPIAFGDDDKAETHLKMAIKMNPNGIDPNYFYGDFLLHKERYSEARAYLTHALNAQDRPNRVVADQGRRQEIKAALAKIKQKDKNSEKTNYN